MDQYGAISVTAEATPQQLVRSAWRDLASVAAGLLFTAAIAAIGTVFVTFALLAFWVTAPVCLVAITIAIRRYRRAHPRPVV
jgi:hypothetical protein